MPTIIDALVVTLGLDSKGLDKSAPVAGKKLKDLEGQSDKTEKSVKKLGSTSKETGEGFSDLTRAAAGFLAVIGGISAIKGMVSDFIETNSQLKRLSDNLGESVSEISAWGQAVEQSGGSAAGLQGTLDMLSKSQTQLKTTGESSLIPYLSMLGVSLVDVNNKALSATDELSAIGDGIDRARSRGMSRPDANNILRSMGIDQGTANLLLKSRGERELLIKRIKEQTAAQNAQGESAEKFRVKLVQLQQKFEAFGRSLFMQAAPALEKVLDWLLKLGGWVMQNSQIVGDFLKVVAVGLGAIAIAAAPMSLVAVAILGVAAAIALLWQDYQTWKRGGDSLIDWSKWEPGITWATNAIKNLGETIKTTIEFMRTLTDMGRNFLDAHGMGAVNKLSDGMREGTREQLGLSYTDLAGKFHPGGNQNYKGSARTGSNAETLGHAIERMEGEYAKGNSPNRPQRNNNPGNIEYGPYAKAHGATGSDGRFAIFPNYDMGHKALIDLLQSPKYANLTVAEAINKYAPSKENDTAGYIRSVTKGTGLNPNTILSGIPGAASGIDSRFMGTMAAPADSSKTVHIGTIEVHTQATDAPGIAQGIGDALSNYLFTSQANTGLR